MGAIGLGFGQHQIGVRRDLAIVSESDRGQLGRTRLLQELETERIALRVHRLFLEVDRARRCVGRKPVVRRAQGGAQVLGYAVDMSLDRVLARITRADLIVQPVQQCGLDREPEVPHDLGVPETEAERPGEGPIRVITRRIRHEQIGQHQGAALPVHVIDHLPGDRGAYPAATTTRRNGNADPRHLPVVGERKPPEATPRIASPSHAAHRPFREPGSSWRRSANLSAALPYDAHGRSERNASLHAAWAAAKPVSSGRCGSTRRTSMAPERSKGCTGATADLTRFRFPHCRGSPGPWPSRSSAMIAEASTICRTRCPTRC